MSKNKKPKAADIDTEIEGTFSCQACSGLAFTRINDLPVQEYAGVIRGEAFLRIERTIVKCDGCNQHSILTRYTK